MPKLAVAGIAALVAGSVLLGVPSVSRAQQQELDQSVQTQKQIVKDAAATQSTVNGIADQTQQLLQQYLLDEQQIQQLKTYNDNLQSLVNDQTKRVTSLQKQLGQIGDVSKGIIPLMEEMIAGLKNFIQLDVPFQLQARERTVQQLEDLMGSSDVTTAEKYRQIMTAYSSELDSGRTMDAYRGQLAVNGRAQTVDFLRIGRVVLCYQTLDQSQTGCWDQRTRQWHTMDGYRQQVATGLAMARKQTSPQMLVLPVPAPKPAPEQAPTQQTQ